MTALLVLLIIAAVLWLIGRLRLGGLVQYDQDGLLVKVLAGPLKLTVFPRKPPNPAEEEKRKAKERRKKAKREAKKAKAAGKKAAKKARKEARWRKEHPGEELPPEKKGGALPPILDLLPLVGEAAGGMKRRIRIDELTLRLTWAAADPVEAALGYGRANAALGMIWPLVDNNFKVKEHDLGVTVDFNSSSPAIFCRAALTARLGQMLSFALRLAVKFLVIWSKSRSAKKQEA